MIETIDQVWEALKRCPLCGRMMSRKSSDSGKRQGIVHGRNLEDSDCALGIWNKNLAIKPPVQNGNFFFWVWKWNLVAEEMSFEEFERRLKLEAFQ